LYMPARRPKLESTALDKAKALFRRHGGMMRMTPVFADDAQKQTQWRAFLRKTRLTDAPSALPDVIMALASFLLPIAQAIVNGHAFNHTWKARGPWR
jgi:hypothetical protein